jgi:hypothetical protein
MARKLKIMENENTHCRTWNIARNTEKLKKWEIHTLGTGLLRENQQTRKIETQTLFHLEYGEKHSKTWKMRNTHWRTWSMSRNSEKSQKWEIHTLGPGLWREKWKTWKMTQKQYMTWNMSRNTENVENETHSL